MQHDVVPGSSGGWTVAPTFQPVTCPSSPASGATFAKSSFGTLFGAHVSVTGPGVVVGRAPTWIV